MLISRGTKKKLRSIFVFKIKNKTIVFKIIFKTLKINESRKEKKIKSEIGVHFEVLESEVQGENEVESVGEEKDSEHSVREITKCGDNYQ